MYVNLSLSLSSLLYYWVLFSPPARERTHGGEMRREREKEREREREMEEARAAPKSCALESVFFLATSEFLRYY
jgi:hypothetical protein